MSTDSQLSATDLTVFEVALRVLHDSPVLVNTCEGIADTMIRRGLYHGEAKSLRANISSLFGQHIARRGDACGVRKVARGKFIAISLEPPANNTASPDADASKPFAADRKARRTTRTAADAACEALLRSGCDMHLVDICDSVHEHEPEFAAGYTNLLAALRNALDDLAKNTKPKVLKSGKGIYRLAGSSATPSISPLDKMKQLDVVETVLSAFGERRAMHTTMIANIAIAMNLLETDSQVPHRSLASAIFSDIRRRRDGDLPPRFISKDGYVSLAQWSNSAFDGHAAEHNDAVFTQYLRRLKEASPEYFEKLIEMLLKALGFVETERTRYSGDGGVDIRGTLYVAGRKAPLRVVVQVKRWQRNVQAKDVREIRGCLKGEEQAWLMTTSDFCSGAEKEAADSEKRLVVLYSGMEIVRLLVEHGIGVTATQVQIYKLDDALPVLPDQCTPPIVEEVVAKPVSKERRPRRRPRVVGGRTQARRAI